MKDAPGHSSRLPASRLTRSIPESQTPDTFPTPPKKTRTFQAGQPDPHVFILLTAPSSPARPPLLAAGAAKREARGCGTRR